MSRPRTARFWAITGAAALGVAAAAALCGWQLSRAAQKEALHAAMEQRRQLPALDARALAAAADTAALLFRPVVLHGRWLAQHTVFLDNRQMDARVGFYVVTPLELDAGGAVAVQRGWVPRNFNERERLPAIDTPSGPVEVRGFIAPPPARLYELGTPPAGAIRQNLDLLAYAAQAGLPLRGDVSVQQSGPPSEGLRRDWPVAGTGAEKNYGYAFQWFALGALIALLYVWFQFIVPRRRAR